MLGTIPERVTRPQFQILRDEPVYKIVKQFASVADMNEIDGWARSFYTLEGHLEAIRQYGKTLLPEPQDPSWLEAKRKMRIEIAQSIEMVQSLSFVRDFDNVPYEGSSAAGYSYEGKKGEGDNFKRAKAIANALVRTYHDHKIEHGLKYAEDFVISNCTPDVAFTRTQLAKLPSIKVRNVFGEAFHYILIEGLSASALLQAFKRVDSFYLTGKDPTEYVPYYLTSLDQQDGWFIVLDWSKFDATVQLWEIDLAFDCLETVLSFPDDLSKDAFEVSKLLFKHRKLAAPDGVLWLRHSGIPSGSYFTNLVGSIINYARILFLCDKLNYRVISCRVQGDDSVVKVEAPDKPNLYGLSSTIEQFGWVLNPAKCLITNKSEDITFLGRGQLQLFNIRERLKVLRLMCFPEYEVDDPQISTARVRMIARDAGFRDPLYNKILYAMLRLYGESEQIPRHLMTYVDLKDWMDVNM